MLTHGNLLSNAHMLKRYWHWRTPAEGGDVLIHALPIFHVHGLFVASHGALLAGAQDALVRPLRRRRVIARLPRATVFMGVPTLYVRLLGEPALTRDACRNMRALHQRLGAAAGRHLRRSSASAPATPSSSATA